MINKNERAITLIALIITIIILLILIGVTIVMLTGESGILENAKIAAEESKKEAIREELQLAVIGIQTDILINNESLTMEELVRNLKEKQSDYLEENLQQLSSDGNEGIYKGYSFYITPNTYEVILGYKESKTHFTNTAILFDRNTCISTNIQETNLMENEEFTISAQIYVSQIAQKTVNYMSILGNHYGPDGGIVWQFKENSSILYIGGTEEGVEIEYTPYYDKWTDITMSYKQGNMKVYINKILVGELKDYTITPYQNLLIGNDATLLDRTMRGMISSVKIWNNSLNENEINEINMLKDTEIMREKLLDEIYFSDKNIDSELGTMIGSNYNIVSYDKKLNYDFKFLGSTCVSTNIQESELMENNTFTIATRVKINQNEQMQVNYMDILGNHRGNYGMIWQFNNISSQLVMDSSVATVIDYTPYYDQWVDIVQTYNQGNNKVYINKKLIAETNNNNFTPYGKLLIGTGYELEDRAMIGNISSVKLWKGELSNTDINNLNMEEINTEVEKEILYREMNFKDIDNILENGIFVGTGWDYVLSE